MTDTNTINCWRCGAEIRLAPDPPNLPDWLRNAKPPRILCQNCLARAKKDRDALAEIERLARPWAVSYTHLTLPTN